MKRVSVAMVFLAITVMNLNAQSIIWNISGANPAQYKSISVDELWELQVLANAGAGTQASSRYFYFTNLPEILKKGITGRKKIEIYFSQGLRLENLGDYVTWDSRLSKGVKIPVIPVDGYREL